MWIGLSLLSCVRHPPAASPAPIALVSEDGLAAEIAIEGPLSARLAAPDGAQLVIYYGGEERGSLEPCGCSDTPRGGLPRFAAYIDAARAASPDADHIVVNGGYWLEDAVALDGQVRLDTRLRNQWMAAGLLALGVDALNLGYNDLLAWPSLADAPDRDALPVVSASLRAPGVATHHLLTTPHGLTVAITGISTPGSPSVPLPEGTSAAEPLRAARPVLEALRPQADVVVLLAYQAPEAARRLAADGLVDVIIDTDRHRERRAPFWQAGAVWVFSHEQTQRAGELRLRLDAEGRVVGAVDRKIDLDPAIPSARGVLTVAQAAQQEIEAAERALFGR